MTPTNSGKCLVTGGAGFIGCAISSGLARLYEQVVVMDNLHPQVHARRERPAALDPSCELLIRDVTLAESWDELLPRFKPDAVVHLAAETGTGQSLLESTRHAMVNVVGTTQMLDGFSRHGHQPRRIVLTSSRAVYGEGCWTRADGSDYYPGQRDRPQLESGQWDFLDARPVPSSAGRTIPQPTSVYGVTKLTQEQLLRAWCLALGTSPRILRLQNVYGPGQSLSNPYTGIVSLFTRIAKSGLSIPLYEDGAMTRDFILIDDVARAILSALTAADELTLDIGTGRAASIKTVAEIIGRRYGAPAPHVCGKYRDGDVRHAACEIGPTLSSLDWKPEVDLETGIDRLCSWIDESVDVAAP